ncbi:flagellar protein FliT [Massilia niastensis]|uniref:flagellar protein FliT n=1 Tax=Massilia niastensis TaxID=544911 RepID=UPI0003A610BD
MKMTGQEVVSVYETMVGITDQMLDAATANDWDRMVELEQACADCVRRLKENEDAQPLAGQERLRKVNAIRRMLDADRQIRDLTTPWMARLSALISNTTTERRVARAYGV